MDRNSQGDQAKLVFYSMIMRIHEKKDFQANSTLGLAKVLTNWSCNLITDVLKQSDEVKMVLSNSIRETLFLYYFNKCQRSHFRWIFCCVHNALLAL